MEEVSEDEVLAACGNGRVLDCGDAGTRRVVQGELLRRCCVKFSDRIDARGIRLKSALITGQLDLAGLEVPFPLRFEDCAFDSAPLIEGARLHALAITGCDRLPGLLANGVRIRHDLDLSRTGVTGTHKTSASTSRRAAVWLCEADIGGRVLCVDTHIDAGGERAIQADRMHVGGTVRLLHQFTARGEMRLLGAHIDGSIDFTGARVSSPTGVAVDLGDATIGGSVFLITDSTGRRPEVQGRIDMGSTRISGQFLIRGAILKAGGTPVGSGYSPLRAAGTALSAPRLMVGAEMTLEDGCHVTGGIDLSMSELSSLFIETGCRLEAPGRRVLDLTNAELLATFTIGENTAVQGTVRLSGARIHGNVCLRGADLTMPEGRSLLAAQGARIDGEAQLRLLKATGGGLDFRSATIGAVVDANGACLHNPGGYTLDLHQATVGGSVLLINGFESIGVVVLNRATIDGRLRCTGGSFDCPGPTERNRQSQAIEAISAEVRGGMDLGWTTVAPSVDFTNTRTSFLADSPGTWPGRFTISGLTYDRFEQPQDSPAGRTWDENARCAWLGRQAEYDAGPYEQAARVFRQHGYTDGAKAILIAKSRRARRGITGVWALPRRALDVAYSLTVGYGYRPGRVLWLLIILLILVTGTFEIPGARATMRANSPTGVVYTTQGPLRSAAATQARADACGDGQVRCFNPVLYAIDTVVPLISLDQRSTWYPDVHSSDGGVMQVWLTVAAVLGWLLTSVFVLSLAGLARSL